MKNVIHYTLVLFMAIGLYACGEGERDSPISEDVPEDVDKEVATEPIEPDVKGVEIPYETDTTKMMGYMAFDKNVTGPVPGILIVHEWWGHTDYVRQRADMLAELGYVAFALDMYGNGKQAAHPEDAKKFSGKVMKNLDEAKARFTKALATLKDYEKTDPDKIVAIGYCFGGSVALTMANSGMDLDGVAAFHSGLNLPVMPNEDLKAKLLICNGAADPFIPQEQVKQFKSALDSVNADYEYISYEGVKHAFTNPAADSLGKKFELPLDYDEEADKKSWVELQEFINELYGS